MNFYRLKNCFFLIITCCAFIFQSCKNELTGTADENLAPETHCVVDTIVRVGADRLNSLVSINWWGDDGDGFVKGYEFTFDSVITSATDWSFTTLLDSSFVFPIPPGMDTVDFIFHVRAIDNDGLADPTPAILSYPIKNSPPTVQFLAGVNNPTISFPVVKFFWLANDPDGVESLNYYELCWNDTTTTPYQLDIAATAATFEGIDFTGTTTSSKVYINNSLTELPTNIDGLRLNDTNVLYIRVIDKALKKSAFVSSYSIFVKKPVSDVLLVDGYGNFGSTATTFYAQNLQSINITSFDTMQIFQTVGGVNTQLSPDNLTQARVFKLFKAIVWYSNDAAKSLSVGAKTLNQFLDNNGKLFLATYVSSSFDPLSTFLDFTPAQSLVPLPTDTVLLMNNGDSLFAAQPNYPDLKTSSILPNVKPITLSLGSVALYNAELKAKTVSTGAINPWTGPSTIMAKKYGTNGEPDFIFSTLELQKLNGLSNMTDLFTKIFIGEFGL